MNKHFHNPDHIEAFLENKLSPAERIQFQSELEKDPLLKNEINLQEDIIESLRNSRKAELKNRLNNIEVPLTPSYTGVKIAASIVLSGLIGWGIHSYMNSEKAPSADLAEPTAPKVTVITESNSSEKEQINYTISDANTSEKTTAPVVSEDLSKSSANTAEVTKNRTQTKTNSTVTKNTITDNNAAEVSRPELMEQFENEPFQREESLSIPEGNVAQITENRSGIDITVDKNSDKKFHYKYHENKLFLYGNFDSKTYEILELNSHSGKQVYLLVEGNYYLLKSNQLEAAPLTKITDKKLIEDLNKFNK